MSKWVARVRVSLEQQSSFGECGYCVLAEELENGAIYHRELGDIILLERGGCFAETARVIGKQPKRFENPCGPAFIIVSKVAVRP